MEKIRENTNLILDMKKIEEENKYLKSQIIWAVTHYGCVNTDGIIQHLEELVK